MHPDVEAIRRMRYLQRFRSFVREEMRINRRYHGKT